MGSLKASNFLAFSSSFYLAVPLPLTSLGCGRTTRLNKMSRHYS
nr:MAG TPA: hypothetical protein [Caudoviricetes sp.]